MKALALQENYLITFQRQLCRQIRRTPSQNIIFSREGCDNAHRPTLGFYLPMFELEIRK